MISDFNKNTDNILRTNARVWEGGVPSHGREVFQFWGSESCNLVHAVMRFFFYIILIRIWIKIMPYSRTHTETGPE